MPSLFTFFITCTLLTLSALPLASSLPVDLDARQAPPKCSDVAVFYARGTIEPGTVGMLVGPRFRSALQSALSDKSVSFVGVNYPATFAGFAAGGSKEGAANMANAVTAAATSCPKTEIVISGYSQGAQVVHLAAAQLPGEIQNRVAAAVTFGDPMQNERFPGAIADRSTVFCALGDMICSGTSIITLAHFTYASDAPAAAEFVRDLV